MRIQAPLRPPQKPNSMTDPPTPEPDDRFAEARTKIEGHLDMICSISSILSAFKDCPEETIALDPFALAQLNQEVYSRACRISSVLSDLKLSTDERPEQ